MGNIALTVAVLLLAVVAAAALVVLVRRTGVDRRTGTSPSPEQLAEAHIELEEARREAAQIRDKANNDAEEILRKSEAAAETVAQMRKEVEEETRVLKSELKELRADLERRENRLAEREQRLDEEARRQAERARKLAETETRLADRRAELERMEEERRAMLERVAGLTAEQAKNELVQTIENQAKREAALLVREIESEARREGEKRATKIVTLAVQRVATEQTAESVVSVLHLPGDEMKGRIIGREGRNIRAFESTTGVNLIIDDTPEAVLLSSFNPIRREVAKMALSELVTDGRIHPARIEEVVQKAQQDMQNYIRERGDEAALEANVVGLKAGLVQLLGRMQFRTSYGQNILKHSVQVAHLSGIIAAELGIDEAMARRAGLLHDIGKSIDREIEGTHTEIGANLGRRFGEPPEVIDAILNHHDLDRAETLYPIIVNAADAISAARPGARRESLESYIKRLEGLETIATSFPGVENAFAIQAGREIRIIVQPDKVDDASAVLLARDIANRIEQDMEYPGQVQVTVVRESRAVEYAR